MKGNRTLITDSFYEYIVENYAEENEIMKRLKDEYKNHNIPEISITPEQGKLLYLISKMIHAKNILEIGTLIGYSTIWLYESIKNVPKAKITTVEVSKKHYNIAKSFFIKENIINNINIINNKALSIINDLEKEAPFDMIFLDAGKEEYPEYLGFAEILLKKEGIFVIDNTLSKGRIFDDTNKQKGVAQIKLFNRLLSKNKKFESLIIPIADGLTVAIKN